MYQYIASRRPDPGGYLFGSQLRYMAALLVYDVCGCMYVFMNFIWCVWSPPFEIFCTIFALAIQFAQSSDIP